MANQAFLFKSKRYNFISWRAQLLQELLAATTKTKTKTTENIKALMLTNPRPPAKWSRTRPIEAQTKKKANATLTCHRSCGSWAPLLLCWGYLRSFHKAALDFPKCWWPQYRRILDWPSQASTCRWYLTSRGGRFHRSPACEWMWFCCCLLEGARSCSYFSRSRTIAWPPKKATAWKRQSTRSGLCAMQRCQTVHIHCCEFHNLL